MLLKPLLFAFPLVFAALLSACSVKNANFVNSVRDAPTKIGKDDRIVVVLASYIDCGNNESPGCNAPKESASAESSFERCVGTAISARIPSIDLVRAHEFREKVFPGLGFKESPRTENDILAALSDPSTKARIEALGLKYILALQVETKDGEGEWGASGSAGAAAIGKTWIRTSQFKAIVVEINEAKKAGTVEASNAQHKGAGVGFIWIIPVPFYLLSAVESKSCRDLGLALADFLNGKD